jgi:hypothetical protein
MRSLSRAGLRPIQSAPNLNLTAATHGLATRRFSDHCLGLAGRLLAGPGLADGSALLTGRRLCSGQASLFRLGFVFRLSDGFY